MHSDTKKKGRVTLKLTQPQAEFLTNFLLSQEKCLDTIEGLGSLLTSWNEAKGRAMPDGHTVGKEERWGVHIVTMMISDLSVVAADMQRQSWRLAAAK
jgi:hypothetical protein